MNKNKQLFPIVITVLIDMIGFGLILPILAPLISNSESGLVSSDVQGSTRNIIYGLVIAVYPFFQFIGSPILGTLSDQFGRKKVLTLSILGTFIGYALTAFGVLTQNIIFIFIGRGLDGLTGGNISVANSAISDVSSKKERTKNFGLIGVAFGVGFIIGPVLGGILSDPTILPWFGPAIPFIFASILALFNAALIQFNFTETLKTKRKSKINIFIGVQNIYKAFKESEIEQLFLVSFLYMMGFTLFSQVFQLYLTQIIGFGPKDIGYFYGFMGILIIFVQGLLVPRVSKKFTPVQVLRISLLGLAFSMLLLAIFKKIELLYLTIPFIALFNGLSRPNMTAIIANESSDNIQGEVLGITQSLSSLAIMITPILGSYIFSINPIAPMLSGFIILVIAWFIMKWGYREGAKG